VESTIHLKYYNNLCKLFKVYQYGMTYEIAVSLYRSIWNTSEKITHVPECISSSENKKESTVFKCMSVHFCCHKKHESFLFSFTDWEFCFGVEKTNLHSEKWDGKYMKFRNSETQCHVIFKWVLVILFLTEIRLWYIV